MNICVECNHLIRMWPAKHGAVRALGKNNYGCKASQVMPVCHPVTGKIWGGPSTIEVKTTVDTKTDALAFYRICEDVNKGDCEMYEAAIDHNALGT